MKAAYLFTTGFLILLFSCTRPNPSKITFDGQSFELPIKVAKAKEILGLQYACYTGFYKQDIAHHSIETQICGYPLFLGSDNDPEESFYDYYFVGITFFKEGKTIEQFKNDLEAQYNKKFKTEIQGLRVSGEMPPVNLTYHYIKTDEGFFIALKEVSRGSDNKKFVSVSFYKGISEGELPKYLEFVF